MIGLDDLCLATGGQLYGDAVTREFSGISHDPELVRPGDLFVVSSIAESGQDADIERALGAGAAGLLCEAPPTRDVTNITTILVGDARLGLEQWAAFAIRQHHPLTILVLEGAGTSICETLSAVLGSRYPVHMFAGAADGPYQTATAVSRLEPQHAYALFRLSQGRYNTLVDIASILQPQLLVIGSPLASMRGEPVPFVPEDVAQIIRKLPTRGTVVASIYDQDFMQAAKPEAVRLVTYQDELLTESPAQADVAAGHIRFSLDSAVLDLRAGKDNYKDVLFAGSAMQTVGSGVATLATCLPLEFPVRDALATLGAGAPAGAAKVTASSVGAYLLDVRAHHSADQIFSYLDWADQLGNQARRRFLVLGEVGSPGDRLNEICHAIGRHALTSVDAVLALHESSVPVVLAARRAGFPVEASLLPHQHGEVEGFLRANLGQEDLIIVAGARSAIIDRVVSQLTGNAARVVAESPQFRSGEPPRTDRSWLEVDQEAIAANTKTIRRQLQPDVNLIAVLRDNAFRHGLIATARTVAENGANMMGVSALEDAKALRRVGMAIPILLLGYEPPQNIYEAVSEGLVVSLHSHTQAAMLALTSRKMKTRVSCHIKVSIGPKDSGVPVREVISLVRELKKAGQVAIDGIYIEFSPEAGQNWVAESTRQLQQFKQLAANLTASGVDIPNFHAAGSAAMLSIQDSLLSAARIGHLLFGISPFPTMRLPSGLKPALTWKTSLSDLTQEQPKQRGGQTRRLGILPVGTRDGLTRLTRNQGTVLIGGLRVPLTGAMGQDWAQVDLALVPDAVIGSEVVLIGAQGKERITIEELASQRGASSYDVITALSPTLPIYPHR